ncbi:MAG TPA: thioredoxin domain-containing protein, partial [Bryobacteraceae bacterium]
MIRRVLNALQVAILVTAVIPAEERPFYDKSTLEEMVRYVMLWGSEIKVEFDRATPSPISGFKEVRVRATYQGTTQTETILVSEDGKRIIQGSVFELNQNPFRNATSRISLRNQPSKGSPDAGVDIVVFSDFQCPACRKLADEMRT